MASCNVLGRKAGGALATSHRQLLKPCRLASLPAFSALNARQHSRSLICRVQEVDIDAQVDAFMKRQAELESGAAFARTVDPNLVIGGDVVSEEMARTYCREIFEVLKTLKNTRDMSVNEVKLVVSIEDPRTKERRMQQGIEDERGVSRDEMAVALLDVAEGRVPKDRIALRCLHEEISQWPFLETPIKDVAAGGGGSVSAAATGTGTTTSTGGVAIKPAAPSQSDYQALKNADTVVKPYVMGQEARAGDKPQSLEEMLPAWVGFLTLYGISAIPVIIVVVVVSILFWSSLK